MAFHNFISRYRKPYKVGSKEFGDRFQLFAQRFLAVEAVNSWPGRLWDAGINHLFDRTEDELASLRGWRGALAGEGAGPVRAALRTSTGTFLRQRPAPMPEEFHNWTGLPTARRVADQGECGSCWAVTAVNLLQLHQDIYNPTASQRTFSAQELVSCVPNPHKCGGSGGCGGATVELAFHWAMNWGLAQEVETPYNGSNGHCKKPWGSYDGLMQVPGFQGGTIDDIVRPGIHLAAPSAGGLWFGMRGWERLPENNYQAVLHAVVERGPVGVSVAARGWHMYSSGVFDGCERDAVIDHAVTLMGFGKDRSLGVQFYLIRNSWGRGWGENGDIRLLRRDTDESQCGTDRHPQLGTSCEGGPKQVKVCGMCGILYDSVVPIFSNSGTGGNTLGSMVGEP